jgi:hypothetical protein
MAWPVGVPLELDLDPLQVEGVDRAGDEVVGASGVTVEWV